MGFFDFLRGKNLKKAEEKERIKPEELESWLKNKKRLNEDKEKELLCSIKQRISQLTNEFEEGIITLKSINWEEKKAESKVKFTVKENLNNYILLLSNLKENLKNLDEKTFEGFIERINFLFADFERKSFMNFQKATFLIGKEFEGVRKSISCFFRDLKDIFESNKMLIESSKTVSFVLSKSDGIKEVEQIKSNVDGEIQKIGQKKADLENKIKYAEKDIEQMIKSEEYAERLKQKKEIKKKENEIKQEIIGLKEMAGLKSLAQIFHENEKKMKIIRRYSENFDEIFEKDNGMDLLNLIEEPKRKQLIEKINGVRIKKEEIDKALSEKDGIASLMAGVEKIRIEIKSLEEEQSHKLKRLQKLEEKKQELLAVIKSEFAKINAEIE